MFTRIIEIIIWPYTAIRDELVYRKKLKEIRKRDPYIYD